MFGAEFEKTAGRFSKATAVLADKYNLSNSAVREIRSNLAQRILDARNAHDGIVRFKGKYLKLRKDHALPKDVLLRARGSHITGSGPLKSYDVSSVKEIPRRGLYKGPIEISRTTKDSGWRKDVTVLNRNGRSKEKTMIPTYDGLEYQGYKAIKKNRSK